MPCRRPYPPGYRVRVTDPQPAKQLPHDRFWHADTLAVALGRPAREPDAPLNHPIMPASTYVAGGETGYGRYGNPAWTALEQTAGALEGGTAISFASGMAAVQAILSLVPPGGRLVLADSCYLGVAAVVGAAVDRGAFSLVTVSVTDTSGVLAAARDADLVWLESPTNPLMEVADLAAIGAGLHDLPARLVVDSTFASPLVQRPLDLGADIVVHSATKLLSGHSDALLGLAIATDPAVVEALGTHRRLGGAIPGSLETYLVLRGIRTLPLRLERAQSTTRELAGRLATHPGVDRVRYPGFGSLLSIDLPDAAAADRLVGGTALWVNATSLGGVESSFERRRRWPGESVDVPEGLVRMSVGIEHPADLWADLDRALNP